MKVSRVIVLIVAVLISTGCASIPTSQAMGSIPPVATVHVEDQKVLAEPIPTTVEVLPKKAIPTFTAPVSPATTPPGPALIAEDSMVTPPKAADVTPARPENPVTAGTRPAESPAPPRKGIPGQVLAGTISGVKKTTPVVSPKPRPKLPPEAAGLPLEKLKARPLIPVRVNRVEEQSLRRERDALRDQLAKTQTMSNQLADQKKESEDLRRQVNDLQEVANKALVAQPILRDKNKELADRVERYPIRLVSVGAVVGALMVILIWTLSSFFAQRRFHRKNFSAPYTVVVESMYGDDRIFRLCGMRGKKPLYRCGQCRKPVTRNEFGEHLPRHGREDFEETTIATAPEFLGQSIPPPVEAVEPPPAVPEPEAVPPEQEILLNEGGEIIQFPAEAKEASDSTQKIPRARPGVA